MQIVNTRMLSNSLLQMILLTGVVLASFVGVVNPRAGAIIFAFASCLLLYSTSLDVALPLMIAILPFDFHRQIGGQWFYLDLIFIGLALPLMRARESLNRRSLLFLPYFLFFVLSGGLRAVNPVWFWGYTIRWAIGLILAYAVFSYKGRESIIVVLGATLVPLFLYAVFQLMIGNFGSLWEWLYPHMLDQPWESRAYSFFWWPNAYGNYCAGVTIMLLALAANGYRRITCLLLAACGAGGLVLSGSRGAIVAFVAGLLVLLLRSKKVLRSMAIAVSIAICLWLIIPWDGTMFERTEESSYQSRMVLWAGAFTAFVQHPVAGIGSTNLAPTMSDYSDRELAHGHNVYLQILAENGVIGFVLFFAPLAYLIWRAMKTANDRVMLASSLALIVFLTHGVTDNVLMADNPPCLFLFFCVVGLSQASCVASNVSSITGLSQAPSLLCDDK